MTELSKTTFFFVAALAAIALALFTRPSTEEYNVDELRGTQLVEEFSSEAPKRLRITSVDENTGDVDAFEVAEINGVWSIPSKSGYPADATEQMAAAVEGVVGREILTATPIGAGDYATYGVVDPGDTSADEGFGTHVRLSDESDNVLADLIIGKQVTGADDQYWVRKAKQDVVYAVEIDLEKFSTDFSDWIEKDLLGLSTFDVSQVQIDDYTIETQVVLTNRGLEQDIIEDRRAKMHLVFDDEDNKWQAESLAQYNPATKEYEAFTLGENEELNSDTLREFKNALDDLEIVDVERKPEGLSADLKAGDDFINSRETVESLARRGFLPTRDPSNPQGDIILLSSEGEIVVTLKDGVEYVLRFGDLQLDPSEQAAAATGAETAEAVNVDEEGLNRYLFVMARFNEAAIEKPELEELPELPSGDESAEESDSAEQAEPAAGETSQTSEDSEADEAAEADDTEADDTEADDKEQGADEAPTREELEAERERIQENNKRAEEEYQEKLAAGKKRVEELNTRFGDWYYVIPNDVFKKIHLGRDDVIKADEDQEGEAAEADANESVIGAPGTAIPGLPSLGPASNTEAADTESSTSDTGADEAAEDPATEATGEPAAATAADSAETAASENP